MGISSFSAINNCVVDVVPLRRLPTGSCFYSPGWEGFRLEWCERDREGLIVLVEDGYDSLGCGIVIILSSFILDLFNVNEWNNLE